MKRSFWTEISSGSRGLREGDWNERKENFRTDRPRPLTGRTKASPVSFRRSCFLLPRCFSSPWGASPPISKPPREGTFSARGSSWHEGAGPGVGRRLPGKARPALSEGHTPGSLWTICSSLLKEAVLSPKGSRPRFWRIRRRCRKGVPRPPPACPRRSSANISRGRVGRRVAHFCRMGKEARMRRCPPV